MSGGESRIDDDPLFAEDPWSVIPDRPEGRSADPRITAVLYPISAWLLGAVGPCVLLAQRGLWGQVGIIAAVAGVWEILLRILPAPVSWSRSLKLVLFLLAPFAIWHLVGRAPVIVSLLGVLAADSALLEASTGGRTLPRGRNRVVSLSLVSIGAAEVGWIRFENLALSGSILIVGLVVTYAADHYPERMANADDAWRRGIASVARGIASIALFVVSGLLLYLPGAVGRVADAVRRRRVRPSYWRNRDVSPREVRRDANRPFVSTPARLRTRRLVLGVVGAILVASVVISLNSTDRQTAAFQNSKARGASEPAAQHNVFQRARDVRFSDLASYEGVPFADDLKEEQDRFSNEHLVPSDIGFYDVGDFSGEYTNVSDGERRTSEPQTCDCQRRTVWLVGGSAAFGLGQRDQHTIASELVRLAHSDGVMLDVHNLGVPGWTVYQERQKIEHRLELHDPPDLVLFYDGFNDVVGAVISSALHGIEKSGTNLLRGDDIEELSAKNIDPTDVGSASEIGHLAAERYRREQAKLISGLDGQGINSVFAFQPDAFAAGHQFKAVESIYPMTNEQRTFVDEALEVASQDLSDTGINMRHLFDTERTPVFVDLVHTNEMGATMAAEHLLPVIIEALGLS